MTVRRFVTVCALALSAVLALATPAMAQPTYPPSTNGKAQVLIPGVTFIPGQGGSKKVILTTAVTTRTYAPGTLVLVELPANSFSANAGVYVMLSSSCGGSASLGPYTAGTDGSFDFGPLRFSKPCTYTLTFTTAATSLGLGGGRALPAGVAAATGAGTYRLEITVPAGASSALPKTGGNGFGVLWVGLILLAVGIAFVALTTVRARRR